MNCLICDSTILYSPSWRGLFLRDIEEAACKKCKAEFEKVHAGGCRICGLPGAPLCQDCSYWEITEYAGVIQSGKGLYHYNEAMRTFLHQYKFLQDIALANVFAADIQQALRKPEGVLVPIPMNAGKLIERTFPQVDRLLDAAGMHYQQFLIKSEAVQGTKTKAERMAVKNLFTWNGEAVPEKVMLIDDLYTTGATMRQAAKVLKEAGAEEIRIFTLIRG